jgi:hypothetical protein
MEYQSVSHGSMRNAELRSMARKSKVYPMRVDPKLWAAAKEAAAAEHRSIAALIEEVLKEDLMRRGFWKAERPIKKRGKRNG